VEKSCYYGIFFVVGKVEMQAAVGNLMEEVVQQCISMQEED
jgi:hypothetical protein